MLIIRYLIKILQMPSAIQLTFIFSCFSIRLSSLCQTTVGRGLPWAPQLRVSESPSRTSTKVGGVFINTGGARTKTAQIKYLSRFTYANGTEDNQSVDLTLTLSSQSKHLQGPNKCLKAENMDLTLPCLYFSPRWNQPC